MKTKRFLPSLAFFSKWMSLLGAVVLLASPLRAFGPPSVKITYNPAVSQLVQGEQPLHFGYDLTITSPGVTPVGSLLIGFSVEVVTAPGGVSAQTAAGYVTFSQATVPFTGPNQTVLIRVNLDAPIGAETGDFSYKVTTTGWPTGVGIVDEGTFINMHVDPPSGLTPPSVSITSPVTGTTYTHVLGGPAVPVPVYISGVATQSAPVLTLVASLSAVDVNGAPIITNSPISLLLTSLGSPTATGATTLPVTTPGTYTITATATNIIGPSVATTEFIVNEVVPPPSVAINPPQNNPLYSYVKGLTHVDIPYTYVGKTIGTSAQDGITALTATLSLGGTGDAQVLTPSTMTPTGAGYQTVTASGTLSFGFGTAIVNGAGTHTINATATDVYNQTASDSEIFTVTELVPVITTDIATPLDGSTIPLPPDASALNVPFSFTSAVDHGADGAKVLAVSATLKKGADAPISVAVATGSSLGTPTALGSGTFANVTPDTYTVVATGTNDVLGLSATDTATFNVTPPPPPSIVFTSPTPADGAQLTALTGVPLSVAFGIKTSSVGTPTNPGPAYIRTQSVTLNGLPVTLTSNTASPTGTSFTATGGGTLALSNPAPGTATYELVATGTDAYGAIATATTKFTVVVTDPVIAVTINAPLNNSTYTVPVGGSLPITFKFTGTITSGATVDTLSGALNGTPVTISSYTGIGTSVATGTGTLTITQPGTYTLTAHDTNTASGLYADATISFVVTQSQATPPLTVAITQAPLSTYTLVGSCSTLSIPISFVGKSNSGNYGGQVSTMTATLDGKPVSLATSGIGSPTATSTATLSVTTAGTHVLVVKDTDPFNQVATAQATFTVVQTAPVIAVTVNSPVNGSTYLLSGSSGSCSSGSSISIPFSFASTITTGATIDGLSATLNGNCVSVTKSGLGSAAATGTGTLTISQPGTYTFTAKATYNGCGGCNSSVSATKSVTFTVQKAGPPTVVITSPTQTNISTYCMTCGGVSVPFSFNATSQAGGITKLSASLDGQCLTVTSAGIGSLNATGSGTMAVKSAGTHKLSVTATDGNGSSTATFSFTLTVQTATPTVTISQPTNNAVFTYESDSAAPSIPFTFTAKTSPGASISSVKATLGSNCVTVTTSGLGSDTVTGTGTLKPGCAGTYTLNVTAVSCGVNTTSKVVFTVKQNPPNCSAVWQGSVCQTTAGWGGYNVPCKFQVKKTYSSGSCTTVRDTSVKLSVCEVYSNGSCSTPKIYSSTDYTIDSNNVYCVNLPTSSGSRRYRIEAFCFPTGSNTPSSLGTKEFRTQ